MIHAIAAPHVDSYYAATAKGAVSCAPLKGEATADVCIVGAGYTGLSAALHLAERGYSVIVLEANKVGWGASGRNGGQVGMGQRKDQMDLEAWVGLDDARKLWDIACDSVQLVKDLVARHAIDCDLKPGILHAAWKRSELDYYRDHADHMRKHYGYEGFVPLDEAEFRQRVGSPQYFGGDLSIDGAHLHPLNYALGLARAAMAAGAKIFEDSRVTRLDGGVVETVSGAVKAKTVLLACNGYLGDLEKRAARKIMPINNFVVATAPLGENRMREIIRDGEAVADSKFVINYFRFAADTRLIFGGGENYTHRFPADIKAFVRPHLEEIFPQLKGIGIDHGWGGTLAVTLKRMPHFARLDPGLYVAQGYSGHGVAMATMGGKMIAEAIDGDSARFDMMAKVPCPPFPGGTLLRFPALVAGMLWFSMKDRLGR